jgi:hypothetical protein
MPINEGHYSRIVHDLSDVNHIFSPIYSCCQKKSQPMQDFMVAMQRHSLYLEVHDKMLKDQVRKTTYQYQSTILNSQLHAQLVQLPSFRSANKLPYRNKRNMLQRNPHHGRHRVPNRHRIWFPYILLPSIPILVKPLLARRILKRE